MQRDYLRTLRFIGIECVVLLYIFLWLGFALHTSVHPQIFYKYTYKYFFALFITIILVYPFIKFLLYLTSESNVNIRKNTIRLTPWKKVGVIFAGLIIILVITETYLRTHNLYVKSQPYFLTIDNVQPFLQDKLLPLNNKQNPELHIDAYGFRGDEISLNKRHNTYRIFLLGGSTVLNVIIPYKQSVGKLLQDKLQSKYPGKKIEVLNAGMDGYTSEHSLIQYLFYIKDFRPNLIVLWNGFNDMYYACPNNPISYGGFKRDYSNVFGSMTNVYKTYFFDQALPVSLHIHFFTIDFIQHAFQFNFYSDLGPVFNKRVIPYLVNHGVIKWYPVAWKNYPSLASYRRNLVSIINATRADDVSLILGDQPYLYNLAMDNQYHIPRWFAQTNCVQGMAYPSTQTLIDGMDLFNNTTKEVSRKNNIPFIDIASQIPKNLDYFTDDVHYTPKANQKIGELLFNFIVDNNYIQ